MRRPRARLAAASVAVAAAFALSACGVPVSGSPHALSRNDVPPPAPPTTTTTTPSSIIFVVAWLNASETGISPQLLGAARQSDRLSTVLDALLSGPGVGTSFFSVIPPLTQLLKVTPDPTGLPAAAPPGPITVNLSAEFLDSAPLGQEVLAVEQVVFTLACNLTPADHVSVAFEVDGSPQAVPIGNGTTATGPVTAADYGTLDCTPSSS